MKGRRAYRRKDDFITIEIFWMPDNQILLTMVLRRRALESSTISSPTYSNTVTAIDNEEVCHGVLCYISNTRDIFGLTCRRSRLKHVIMWHFELSSFSIENRFLMTVHLWEFCNFVRSSVLKSECFGKCDDRFWNPLLLESYWFRIKSTGIKKSNIP